MSAFFSKADVEEHQFRLGPNVCFRPQADMPKLGWKVEVISRIGSAGLTHPPRRDGEEAIPSASTDSISSTACCSISR